MVCVCVDSTSCPRLGENAYVHVHVYVCVM